MTNQLKKIQQIELNILREFIRICDKYNLRYYLVEGSLLGAIRHQGMIPWDDDIDVALFREDYETFLRVVNQELQPPYQCRCFQFTDGYIDYIAQLADTSTLIESPYRRQKETKPLWVDIFVIDGMPSGNLSMKFRKFQLLSRKLFLMWSDMEHYVVNRAKRPLYEKVLIRVGDTLHTSTFLSTKKQLQKMDRCMKSCKPDDANLTVNFMSEYKWRTIFPAEYYGEGRMVAFEDFTARIPTEAEKILQSVYGDYMQLPPEDQRYKHSLTVVTLGDTHESD